MQLRTMNHCERTCIYSDRKFLSHELRMGQSKKSRMVNNFIIYYYNNGLGVNLANGEDALLDSTPEQNPFRFRKKCVCQFQTEFLWVMNSSGYFFKRNAETLQENRWNMPLLISLDRLSKSHRNQGSTFSVHVVTRYRRTVFSNALGIPCQTALPVLWSH